MQIDLSGRVAIVTGAARGIGRAIAQALAACGASVVINYRGSAEAAEQVVQQIETDGGRAMAIKGDVSQPDEVEALFKSALAAYNRLDILVNNAGITRDTLLLRMKDEDFHSVLQTNLTGVFLCTRAALRPMTKQRGGRIINISSVVGITGNAGQANYAAAKAGIIGFTRSVAREMASRQITVNAIAPGFIETEMTAALSEEVRKGVLETIPLGRFGQPRDVAALTCFLSSDSAGYITGQTFAVDGGMVMH